MRTISVITGCGIDQAAGGHRVALRLQGKGAAVMTYTHQEQVHATRKWHSYDALPRPGFKSNLCLFRVAGAKRNARLRPTTTTVGGGGLLSFPRRDHSRNAQAV